MRPIRGSPDSERRDVSNVASYTFLSEWSGFRGTGYFNNKAGGVSFYAMTKTIKAVAPIHLLVLFYPQFLNTISHF